MRRVMRDCSTRLAHRAEVCAPDAGLDGWPCTDVPEEGQSTRGSPRGRAGSELDAFLAEDHALHQADPQQVGQE
jgi:hypothetical protein